MSAELQSIQTGMPVYGIDAQKIGTVSRVVVPDTDPGKITGAPQPAPVDVGPAAGAGYFYVEDPGVLGIGATGLCVPFSAVREVTPGRGVVLAIGKDECRTRYGEGPSLEIDENASITPH